MQRPPRLPLLVLAALFLALATGRAAWAEELVIATTNAAGDVVLYRGGIGTAWTGPLRVRPAGPSLPVPRAIGTPALARQGQLLRMAWVDPAGDVRFASGPDATSLVMAPGPMNPPGSRLPTDPARAAQLALGERAILAFQRAASGGSVVDVATGQVRATVLDGSVTLATIMAGQGKFIIAATRIATGGDETVRLLQSTDDGGTWSQVPFTFVLRAGTMASGSFLTFGQGASGRGHWSLLVPLTVPAPSGSGRVPSLCRIFGSDDGLSWPRESPPGDFPCQPIEFARTIQFGATPVTIATSALSSPPRRIDFTSSRPLPAPPLGSLPPFALAIAPSPPSGPACATLTTLNATRTSSEVVLQGATPGLTYTVSATGLFTAFTTPQSRNSCQITDRRPHSCAATADASGIARCTLANLSPGSEYSLASSSGQAVMRQCTGTLRTPDDVIFSTSCAPPAGDGGLCNPPTRFQFTPCVPTTFAQLVYMAPDWQCHPVQVTYTVEGPGTQGFMSHARLTPFRSSGQQLPGGAPITFQYDQAATTENRLGPNAPDTRDPTTSTAISFRVGEPRIFSISARALIQRAGSTFAHCSATNLTSWGGAVRISTQ